MYICSKQWMMLRACLLWNQICLYWEIALAMNRYICVYMYIYTYVHIYYMCVYGIRQSYQDGYVVCVLYVYIYVARAHTHKYIYIYIYIYTHTHTHTEIMRTDCAGSLLWLRIRCCIHTYIRILHTHIRTLHTYIWILHTYI